MSVQIFLRNKGARDVQSVALEFNEKIVSIWTLSSPKLKFYSGDRGVLTLDLCELAYWESGVVLEEEESFHFLTGGSEDGKTTEFGLCARL